MNINGWSPTWICALLFCGVSSLTSSAKRGFHDKLLSAKQQLTYNVYQNSRDQNNLKIDTSMLWSQPFEMQSKSDIIPIIIRTSNLTLVLNKLDVLALKNQKLQYCSTITTSFGYGIKFVKGFEWHDRVFLLLCFQQKHVCSLFSAASDLKFIYHQSISDVHNWSIVGVPTDAQFFVQREKLYLTILFRGIDSTISQLRIYRWHNLYMDKEDSERMVPDIVSTATSITVFGHGEDIVLVLRCPGDDPVKFSSQVWSRKPNGEMTKVQYLPTDRPISITHFMERGENFILILERDQDASIYWWEGSEFVRWLSVDGAMKDFEVAASGNLKYTTFLTFTHSNILRLYLMTSAKLDKIYETEFLSDNMNEVISIKSATVFEENGVPYMLVLTKHLSQVFISLHKISVQILNTVAKEEPSIKVHPSDTAQGALDTVYNEVRYLKNKMDILDHLSSSVLLTNRDVTISGLVKVSQEVYMEAGEILEITHRHMDVASLIQDLYSCNALLTEGIISSWKELKTTFINPGRHLTFNGNVSVKKAKINSLTAKMVNGNSLDPKSFLYVNRPSQRLKSVKAKTLSVDWLAVREIGNSMVQDFLLTDSRVNVSVRVAGLESRNLRINENTTINNITVKDLTNKMVTVESEADNFNKISQIGAGKNPARPGTFKLQNNTVIQNLYVDLIDGDSVNDILTSVFVREIKNVIHGDLHFQHGVRTNQVAAGRFNLPEKQSFPYSPPVYRPLPPSELQYPHYWPSLNSFTHGGRTIKRDHSEEAEIIIRKVKVKIIGDLKVAELEFRNSSMVVGNHSVPTSDLGNTLWTRNTPQKINGSVHFVNGISIGSSLRSPIVNGQNLSSYASRRSGFNSLTLENVHVDGNITTGENASVWMRENQLQDSVFKVLNVKHLKTEQINGENIKSMLRTRHLLGGELKIITEKLKIGGDLDAELINNIDVKQKLKSAVMIDNDLKLNEVEFKNISGDNIKVKHLNNHSLESLMGFSSRENSSVFIHGDIQVSQLSAVASVNGHPADFTKVVNKRKGATIYGKKKFQAQIVISEEFKITNINNVHFESWSENILRVSGDQNVTGFYTMRKAEIKSEFDVDTINGVSLSTFVYTNEPQVNLLNNLRFKTISVDGNVSSASLNGNCLLPKVEDEIVFEQISNWSTVDVSGDSVWPRTGGGRLQHLFESAVRSQGNQTITGDVTFTLLSVPNVQVQSLNDKNITFVFHDSLSRRKKNQVITGRTNFLESFKCKNIEVKGDAKVISINNININEIEEKLVRRSGYGNETVFGHKIFLNGFRAFSLDCPGGVNGVKAENIIGRRFTGTAPPIVVRSLKVYGPLVVDTINDLNLNNFLEDIIYLECDDKQLIKGQLHVIGNVSLQGPATASSINNISTNDLVFINNKKNPVRISGCKRFVSNIEVESDPTIDILNGRNLKETFQDNVKIDQNVTINGSVMIESEVEVDTIFAHEYLVGSKKLIYLNKTFFP